VIGTYVRVSALVAALAAIGGWVVWLHVPHHRTKPLIPMPAGAYLTGGVPARDPELENVLAEDLAAFVLETDEDAHGRSAAAMSRPGHEKTLRAAPAIAAYGPALAASWNAMITALDHWDSAMTKRGIVELRAAAFAMSEQLAALGLAYHLEASAMGDHAIVFAFEVAVVAYEHAGDKSVRVLSLRRMDRLNVEHTLLGMQTEEGGDPVVMLDQIDDLIASKLATPGWFELGDAAWTESAEGRHVDYAAGTAISRELALLSPNAVHRAVVATVRRHEARHAIDIALDTPLPYPAALSRYVGDRGTFTVRARAELAAYLCQIASDPVTPQLALWNLANLGFGKDHRGSAESFVAAVVIESLARHLGVPERGPAVKDGVIDRAALSALARPLAALSDAALRDAAREVWLDLYHTPLELIVDG
jgi:hypothetical protein